MDILPLIIARLKTWQQALLCAALGALSVLAMAPFALWPVLFVSLTAFVWTLDGVWARRDEDSPPLQSFRRRCVRAGFVGWAFGFGYFLAGIYWIGYAFYVDSDRYSPLMPFAVAGLTLGLGLFHGAAAAIAAVMWRPGYARLFAFAFAFFSAEAARGYLLTGFPWNLIGEGLAATDEHMQLAAYIGIYGLTLAALLIFPVAAAAIGIPSARGRRLLTPILLSAIFLVGSYVFGHERLKSAVENVKNVRVRIVQPNIPQQQKWKTENRRWIFDRALSLSRSGTTGEDISAFTHVIWPESSVPFLFVFNGEIASAEAKSLFAGLIPDGTRLVIGAERAEGRVEPGGQYRFDRVFNSLFVMGEGARLDQTYDKIHLVPFGEYVPLSHFMTMAGLRPFSHQLDGFEAGSRQPPLIQTPHAPRFLPLICYEIIFPGRVSNVRNRPEWLLNITNDAWFGNSTGPYQHLHQARVRAVEEGVPIMRAANTGISAVIDPFGRILAKLDLGREGVIDHELPGALPITLYEKYRMPSFIVLFLFSLECYLAMVALAKVSRS